MTCDPYWTAYLSALLTPIVAVLGPVIAYRQWRTAQNKHKQELFDRRFVVCSAATTLLAYRSGRAKDDELFKCLSADRDAKGLYNSEIAVYLGKELWRKATELQCLVSELEGLPVGEERTGNVHKGGT